MAQAPQRSDVFPYVPPFVSGERYGNLGPGLIELPDGTILDGINARTIPPGSEEWYRIMDSANAPHDFEQFQRDLELRAVEEARRERDERLLQPPDPNVRQLMLVDVDDGEARSKERAFLAVAAIVAIVLYTTRRK